MRALQLVWAKLKDALATALKAALVVVLMVSGLVT